MRLFNMWSTSVVFLLKVCQIVHVHIIYSVCRLILLLLNQLTMMILLTLMIKLFVFHYQWIRPHLLRCRPYDQDRYLTLNELMTADNWMLDFALVNVSVVHWELDRFVSMNCLLPIDLFVDDTFLERIHVMILEHVDEVDQQVI